ncbi:hypothetical protein BATDEDRAFT_90626 [Batrachochytrium dendrobatidis JAM81]|uniref:Uncharacterized protein n=1 Tax=Batrachochytrium dendrobatidis (strain JAM81 / FGSC 10211) TaxID=684364 RepID=F4P8D1_BATDJ|nr:uncharacterized protein BATDEDRAFT_90626 [Batrachochytrium dendrobatidis JAM81]EGF78413.1 hypothetical protein BATDEDRAFT_90626 [Batrachochytrium dendrobatidis JAM81]|eukprot:XP_006680829.1 hypothetical protein BATDEDRAFT_90626 [Batrachochytrium dendrobatidis JAM81]
MAVILTMTVEVLVPALVVVVALGLTGLVVVKEQANMIDANTVTASFIMLVCKVVMVV